MSLPRDVYWANEDKKGNLSREHTIWGINTPLYYARKDAKIHCVEGERPVKVRIFKVQHVGAGIYRPMEED